jgi:hypothetical protein
MSEWPMVKLKELMRKTKSIDPGKYPDEEFVLYSIPAYDNGIPEKIFGRDIGSSKILLKDSDVVLSKIVPHIRRTWVITDGEKQIGSSEWIVFNDDRFDPQFIANYLKSDVFHYQLLTTVAGVGGSLNRARPAAVAELKIPLPPLGEQKRIAEILGQTTKAISSVQNQIEQVKKLRSSIVGTASKIAVELRALSEYFDINPRQPRNIPDNAPTSFVPMANLDETFGISPITSRFSEHKKGYTYFENGDILLAKITPCFENGKSAIAKLSTQIGHGSTEFHVLRHKNHMHQDVCLSPLLVAAILKQPSFLKPAENFMRGSAGQKRIPVSYIASLKVPVLKSVDLEKIDQSLEIVEALLNLYHRKLSLLQELQKSLANRAFAGLL